MFPNLNAEIARAGLTNAEVAKKANMSYSTFSLKMNGKSKFTFDETLRIKKAIGVDIPLEELFTKKEVM
jgi:predicted transcriptional regulator